MPKVTEPNSKIQSSNYYWSNGDPGWCRLDRVKSSTTKETIDLDSGKILRKRLQNEVLKMDELALEGRFMVSKMMKEEPGTPMDTLIGLYYHHRVRP